jgi:hypothetical protein
VLALAGTARRRMPLRPQRAAAVLRSMRRRSDTRSRHQPPRAPRRPSASLVSTQASRRS